MGFIKSSPLSTLLLLFIVDHGLPAVMKSVYEPITGTILKVNYEGKELRLNNDCNGGIVFRDPLKINQICTKKSLFMRKSACSNAGQRTIESFSEKFICQNVSEKIQAIHYFAEAPTNLHAIPDNEEVKAVDNNLVLRKRQAPPPETNESANASKGSNSTVKNEDVQNNGTQPPEEDPEVFSFKDLPEAESQEAVSYEQDTFSEEKSESGKTLLDSIAKDSVGRPGHIYSNMKSISLDDRDPDISFENDDLGSWENINNVLAQGEYHPLPEPGTLEYDALMGGLDKWFPTYQSSPIFDSYVSLIKSIVNAELSDGCSEFYCTDTSSTGGHSSSYNILNKYQPYNETWYQVLEQMALIADALIPPSLLSNRAEGGYEIAPFRSQLFYNVLNVFGFQTRTLTDQEVNAGMNLEEEKEAWNEVLQNFSRCRSNAEEASRRISLVYRQTSNCDNIAEIGLIEITKPEWDERSKSFGQRYSTINYTSQVDPNSYLPPHMARINYRSWIFGELLWYSVQLSYAFCFKEFENPSGFMRAIAKMLKLFETEVVQDIWNAPMSGGNLDVFENMLPFITHSAHEDESGSPNANDFRRLLTNLDKISYALHRESLLDHWMQRPQKRRGGGEKRSSFMERSRKRRGLEDGIKSVPLSMNERMQNRNDNDEEGEEDVTEQSIITTEKLKHSSSTTTSTAKSKVSDVTTPPPEKNKETNVYEKLSEPGIPIATTKATKAVPNIIPNANALKAITSTKEPTTISPKTSPAVFEPVRTSSTPSTTSTTPKTTSTTSTTTTKPAILALKEYEIWDGLAYCLVSGDDLKNGVWGEVKPTLEELEKYGICRNE